MALVPVPALPTPGWVTRARDLPPLWASGSLSVNRRDGLRWTSRPQHKCSHTAGAQLSGTLVTWSLVPQASRGT